MKIPFVSFLPMEHELDKDLRNAFERVYKRSWYINGIEDTAFEKAFADYCGTDYCVGTGNGLDALMLALKALDVGRGDEVIVPANTFIATAMAVTYVGAKPVFVDVDPLTYNIDCNSLEKAVEFVAQHTAYQPKAIVAVDLFGQPAEYDRIRAIADRYDMLVLEDAAQSFGGIWKEKRTCSLGDISTTSFFPSKPLGCYGDGGAVFTDNDVCAERLRSIHVHGKGGDKYDNIRIGMNSRLDTLQAAVLLAKMDFLEEELTACARVADRYTARLKDAVQTPHILEDRYSAWAQYVVCLKDNEERNRTIACMKEAGIPSAAFTLMSALKSVIINSAIVRLLGNDSMAVYSVCANAVLIAELCVGGIIGLIQNIAGILYGERDYYGIRTLCRRTLAYSYLAIAVLIALFLAAPQAIAGLFGIARGEMLSLTRTALRIFCLVFPFYVYNKFLMSYYQTILQPGLSTVITVLQGFLVIVPLTL